MALRTKTIEVPIDSRTTTLATATTHTFTTQTVYIPENSSRTFRSVILQIGVMDAQATAFNMTAITVGVTLGAAGASNQAFTNSPSANSGEHQSYVFTRDVTSYFNTNFGSGTSQTFACTFIATGGVTINHCAKLIITFEYDDASATTRGKTVRIPIESGTGAITTTLTQIGTNQIPNLDTFLPESSKTYRHIWFEVEGNDYSVGTVNDPTLNFRIDAGGTTHSTGAFFTDLGSARSFWYLWNIGTGGFTTNATHQFQLASSNVTTAATFNHLGLILCVNYEYDHSASSTIMNSLLFAAESVDFPGATTASDDNRAAVEFYVEEPATVTLVQSGVLARYSAQAAVNPSLQVGSQTARTYTDVALLYCGDTQFMQRFDSGAAGGSGLTLARGKNTLTINNRIATNGTNPTGFQFLVYLNYTSGKSTQGDGAHNHSTYWHIADQYTTAAIAIRYITALAAVNIPETAYYANVINGDLRSYMASPSSGMISLSAERASGEYWGDGWTRQHRSIYNGETENGYWRFMDEMDSVFKAYPNEPSNKLALETSRRWRLASLHATYASIGLWVTYHTITFTAAGDITDSGGGTVDISLHRVSDGALIDTTSRTGNGAYSMTYYDNVDTYFVEARESGTLLGRSENGTLAGSP